jgi:hypothetical protein
MQSRRTVVVGVLAASLVASRAGKAQDDQGPEPPVFGDGVAGGGTFESPAGEAEFSLVAFAQDQGDLPADFVGTFSLQDAAGPEGPLLMETQSLSGYSAPDEESPELRRVIGWATANGSGPFPYILDVEFPVEGLSEDTTLTVLFGEAAAILMGTGKESACDCGGFDYRVKGTVTRGGVNRFAIPQSAG